MSREQNYESLGADYHWRWWVSRMEYRQWIARILSEFPRDGDGKTVLNLGCGDGVPAAQLAMRGFQVHGVDYLADPLTVAQEKVPTATFSPEIPEEPFDYILITDALGELDEHPSTLKAIQNCREYTIVSSDSDEFSQYALERLFKGCNVELLFEDSDHQLFHIQARR